VPKFPYRFEGRIQLLGDLFDDRAELQAYRDEARQILNELSEMYDLRNYLAHGLARFDLSTSTFTVRRIQPEKNGRYAETELEISPSGLPANLTRMSIFCQKVMYFVRRVSEDFDLQF